MNSTERYTCLAAGKTRHSPKTQTAIPYEHLDRDSIISSCQEAATHRSQHSRSTSLPKIATGRSVHSAKKLWQDYECIEVKSKVQRENETPPEVSPLRIPKNPHGLYKHTIKYVKPYHILHSPTDYGQAKYQLRQLYAEVTYLSNAVRNCDGTTSYRGMCKRQQSYRRNDNDSLHLHWRSSDDKIPVPRLLLPVMPGTNTKWYSWKVDTPREKYSPRGGGDGRGKDKRYAASAPVSRSLDFIERYSKKHRVVFSVDDDGGRRSKNSKEADTKSWDGHLSVKSIEGMESLASSLLSSVTKYDASRFKLSEGEGVEGRAIFLTQAETGKVSSIEQVNADMTGDNHHGDQEKKEQKQEDVKPEQDKKKTAEGDDIVKTKYEETPRTVQQQSLEDEMDIIARANEAVGNPWPDPTSDEPLKDKAEGTDNNTSQTLQQDDIISQQENVPVATSVQSEDPILDPQHNTGDITKDIDKIS